MIIFYYGSDQYRLNKEVHSAASSYRTKHGSGLNFFQLDLSESEELIKAETAIKTLSFFDEKKLLVLDNTFSSKNISEKVQGLIEEFDLVNSESVVLLIREPLSQKELEGKNKNLFKILASSKSKIKVLDALGGANLPTWIKSEFKERGLSIESGALSQLVASCGQDSWSLANEIEKLSNYKKTGTITEKDISLLIKPKIVNNIFELIDAVAVRNRVRAYELLYSQLSQDANPSYILSMIIYQFRNLLMVKDASGPSAVIAKRLGIHPFVAQKSIRQSQAFDLSTLKKIYGYLLEMDTRYKRGVADLEMDLNKFVLSI